MHQGFHKRQPDPETALCPVRRSSPLRKQIEDLRQQLGLDALASVGYLDFHRSGPVHKIHLDDSARRSVFGRIVEQIAEDLSKSHAVAADPCRPFLQIQLQAVLPLIDQRQRLLDCGHDNRAQVEHLLL